MFKKLLLIVLVLLQSCKPTEIVTKEVQVKDSVSVKTTLMPRDTIVTISADSISINIPISDITEKPIVKKSKRVRTSIKRVGNSIETKCNADELEKQIAIKDKLIETYRSKKTQEQTTVTIPVRYTPKHIQLLAWVGGVVILLLGFGIVLKIKKII